MADDNKPTGSAGVAEEAPAKKPADAPQQRPLSGRPLIIQFGIPIPGVGAVINGVSIDNFPAQGTQAEINGGSFISLVGIGLDRFDDEYWRLERQGKKPVELKVVSAGTGGEGKNSLRGRWVTLQVPRSEVSGLNPNESLGLSFFSSRIGGKLRTLPMVFVFKSDSSQTQAAQTVSNAPQIPVQPGNMGPGNLSANGGAGVFSGAELGGQVIGGAAKAAAGAFSAGAGDKPASGPIKASGTLKSMSTTASAALGGVQADLDGGGGEVSVSETVKTTGAALPQTVKQSVEVIGEHLDKTPELIVNANVRQKISSALKSGNLSSLSAEEKQTLNTTLKTVTEGGGQVSAQVQAAAGIILNSEITGEAQVKAQGRASTTAEAPVKQTMPAEAEESVQAQTAPSAQPKTQSMSLGQSLQATGEFLQKNNIIPNFKGSRGRILQALANGKINELSEDDREVLAGALKSAKSQAPASLQASLNKTAQAVATGPKAEANISKPSEIKETALKASAPLSVKREFDAKIAQMNTAGRKVDAAVLGKRPEGADEINLSRGKDIKVREKEKAEESVKEGAEGAEIGTQSPQEGELSRQEGMPEEKISPVLPMPPAAPEKTEEEKDEPNSKSGIKRKPEEKSGENNPEELSQDEQNRLAELEEQQARLQNQERLKAVKEQQEQSLARQAAEKEANAALNAVLMKGIMAVWLAAVETLGLSILVGALAGDVIWIFKGWILKKFESGRNILNKFHGGKNAGHLKIELSGKVKLNIIAMNLAVVAVIIFLAGILFAAIRFGCKTYLLRGDYCAVINNMDFESFKSYITVPTVPAAPVGGVCSPVPAGVASPSALAGTCFGQNASPASMIAAAESGGDPGKASRVDICTVDNSVVSWGLFQINLSAHKIGSLDCPKAFSKMYTGSSKDCRVVDQALYQLCVKAATAPDSQIQTACAISGNGSNWNAWLNTKNKCGL